MKGLLIGLVIIPGLSSAIEVTCYSQGQEVYHHQVKDIQVTDTAFLFEEIDTKKDVMYFGDCMFKEPNLIVPKKKHR